MEKLITYIAVDDNAPDYPRAWGQGKDHITAKLNCEIALRKKIIGKLERGNHPNMIDLVDDYIIKEDHTFIKRYGNLWKKSFKFERGLKDLLLGVLEYPPEREERMQITKQMIKNFIGQDQKPLDYLVEMVNDEYAIENFILDILTHNTINSEVKKDGRI